MSIDILASWVFVLPDSIKAGLAYCNFINLDTSQKEKLIEFKKVPAMILITKWFIK